MRARDHEKVPCLSHMQMTNGSIGLIIFYFFEVYKFDNWYYIYYIMIILNVNTDILWSPFKIKRHALAGFQSTNLFYKLIFPFRSGDAMPLIRFIKLFFKEGNKSSAFAMFVSGKQIELF